MSPYIPVELRRRVRELSANRCAYCQTAESLSVAIFEIEHITPRSAGGETALNNLCLACPTCNRFKSDRTEVFDPETQLNIAIFHPRQQKWSDHFRWNRDSTEIVGLTPTGRATIDALRMNRPRMVRVRAMWVAMLEHPPADE